LEVTVAGESQSTSLGITQSQFLNRRRQIAIRGFIGHRKLIPAQTLNEDG
jgi:hypothetical protein